MMTKFLVLSGRRNRRGRIEWDEASVVFGPRALKRYLTTGDDNVVDLVFKIGVTGTLTKQ